MPASKKFYDSEGLAEWLGTTERHVRDLVARREIPFVRIGPRLVRFDPDDIARWLDEQRVPVGGTGAV